MESAFQVISQAGLGVVVEALVTATKGALYQVALKTDAEMEEVTI